MVVGIKVSRAKVGGFEGYLGSNNKIRCKDRFYLGISSDSFRKAHFICSDFSYSVLSKKFIYTQQESRSVQDTRIL